VSRKRYICIIVPVRKALKSKLLETIRAHPEKTKENGGGCGLWKNREWVKSLL